MCQNAKIGKKFGAKKTGRVYTKAVPSLKFIVRSFFTKIRMKFTKIKINHKNKHEIHKNKNEIHKNRILGKKPR